MKGVDLVHGSPADEDEYVVTASDAAPLLALLGAQLTFSATRIGRAVSGCRAGRRDQLAPERTLEHRAGLFLPGKSRIGGAAAGW